MKKISALKVSLEEAGYEPSSIFPSVLAAFEQRLDAALPAELRALLDELGDVPSLGTGGTTLLDAIADELPGVPDGPFPYTNDEAAALMRPDELAFVGELGPPGAVAIARDDATVTYLVVRGEQAGRVWIGSAYGLCPVFDMVEDQAQPIGLLTWYERALLRWREERAAAREQSEGLSEGDEARSGELEPEDATAYHEPEESEVLGDVAALEARVAQATARSEITVPEGIYKLTEPMELHKALTLRATGVVTIVPPEGRPCIRVHATDVVLVDLIVRGAPDESLAIEVAPHASLTLENVVVAGGARGIVIAPHSSMRATNCTLRDLRVGIEVHGLAELRELSISTCAVGVETHHPSRVTITHSHFDSCSTVALRVESGFVKAVTNLIEGSAVNGVEIFAGWVVLERNQLLRTSSRAVAAHGGRTILRSNVIARAEIGILVRSSVSVSNNLIVDTAVGIQAENGLRRERCVIRGNVLLDNHYDGMVLLAGIFDLRFNQCGSNRQTGITLLEEGAPIVANIRDNTFYFHGKDGLQVSLAAPCAPVAVTYSTTFENANAGIRIGAGTLALLLRNTASHDGLLGITTQESSDVSIVECETFRAGVFGIAAWEQSGVAVTRSRDVEAGFAALGSFGDRFKVRDGRAEPPESLERAFLSAAGGAGSEPRTKGITREEVTALFPSAAGYVRSRERVFDDPPVRCAESAVSLAGPARMVITLHQAEDRAPSCVVLPLLVLVQRGHVQSVVRTTATRLTEPFLRALAGVHDPSPSTTVAGPDFEGLANRLLSVAPVHDGRTLRVALVDDRFFLAACLAAASGGPGVRPGLRRLARCPFEVLVRAALPSSSRHDLYLNANARERRELKAELIWNALFSRWQSLPAAWATGDEPHPMLAAALGRTCSSPRWPQ